MTCKMVQKVNEVVDGFRLDFQKVYKVDGVNMDLAIMRTQEDLESYFRYCYGDRKDSEGDSIVFESEAECRASKYQIEARFDMLEEMLLIDYEVWHHIWYSIDRAYWYWCDHYDIQVDHNEIQG